MAEQAEDTHAPADSSHKHGAASRTILLEGVPLLDSPAWSSEDELDNPTYNKRFRHRKHEEIRQRLQQRKLEARERQQQQQQQQPDHLPPQRRASTPQRAHSHSVGSEEVNTTTKAAHPGKRTPSGGNTQADGPASTLERTNTAHSRRSKRSNATQHSQRPRKRDADDVGAAAEHDVAAAPRSGGGGGASAPAAESPAVSGVTAASAAVTSVPFVPAPVPAAEPEKAMSLQAAMSTEAAAGTKAESPGKSAPLVNGHAAQQRGKELSRLVDDHRHTEQPAAPTQAAKSEKTSSASPPLRLAEAKAAALPPAPAPAPAPQTVAFSSTEVQPPTLTATTRGTHTPAPRFSLQKKIKGNTKATASTASSAVPPQAAEKRAAAPPLPPPPPPPPLWAEVLSVNDAVVVAPAPPPLPRTFAKTIITVHQQSPSSPRTNGVASLDSSSFDGAASMPTALDTTRQFVEADLQGERPPVQRSAAASPNGTASATAAGKRPPARGEAAATTVPAAVMEDTHIAEPPLSPLPSSTEPLQLHADEVVAPLSVPTSARSPPRVERRSYSSSVTSNGQPGAAASSMTTQRQQRRSDYYTFSGIPSCFDFMLTGGEVRTEGEAARTATGGAAAALPVTQRASGSTEGRVRVSHDVSFSSADGFSDGNGSYNYEIGEMYEIGGAEEEEEDEEEEASSSSSMHDAASWGDILSPTSAGSDVDYILAYHSSYYGDLLRHLEMTPSRESPGIDSDAAAPVFAKDDAAPDAAVAVLAGPVVRDQTRAATEQPTKPSSRSSTQSAQSSSLGSLDRARHFYSGDVPQSAAPPAYSFYTHLQESRDGRPLTQSQGDFDQDMTALGVADALPSTRKTRNPAEGRRGSSASAEDADSWGYYWTKKESWPAISRSAKARKKSSSMISAKYSLLSSKKGISMRRSSQLVKQAAKLSPAPAPAPAAVPPPASAPVRVLSLQTPVQRVPPSPPATQALPPPQPAMSSVKPLSLENFGSQTVTDSKAFDLHSPVVRKMTAPPEELAGLAGEEDEEREETAVHMVGQQHPQEQLQPQQPTLFSFAGLAVHPPAALRAKRRAAALMGPAAAAVAKQPAARDEPAVQRPPSVPPAVLLESTDTTATPTLAALPPAEASYGDQRVSKTEGETEEAVEAPPQLPLAGPPPATPEPRRFRSLIGSAYLTDVYTSSLRQLTSQRRNTRAVLPGQTAEPAVKETAGVDGGALRGGAPGSPPASKQPPGLPPLDTTHLAAAVAEAGNNTTTTAIFAADDSGRTAATTSTTDTAASPPHRYRRRHHRTTRIDALFAETAMRNSGCSVDGGGSCPLPQPPVCAVRVAGQGSGRAVEAVQAFSQLSSAHRRSASGTALPVRTSNGGIAGSAPLPSDQAGRKASDAETLSGRGWVAPQFLPGRTAATTRSGSSFLRMVASPPSATSPVVRQTPAAATAGIAGGRAAQQPQSQPQPAYIAVEVAPVSVSAMVRRLEANMSAVNAPMAAMASVKGQRPPQPTRHTVSDRRVAAASNAPPGGVAGESSSAAASRQVLSSTQRPVSSCRSDNSNLVKSEAVLNDFTERKGALRTLATLPQRTAASPTLNGNGTHRGGGHAIEQASTSPMNGSRTTTTTAFASVNQPPANRAAVGPNGTKVFSPPPSSSSPPPLTREALMRQQAQQTMIVRDQHGPQSPLHLQPLPVTTASSPSPQQQQQPLPQLRRRDAAGPPSHCNTTEDLLTRITVLGDRRGWSGRPDASIVSTLHSAPSEPPSTASSPTAAGTEQRRAASEAPSPHARERLPGPGDRQREERGCRYQPLQLTHVFGDEGAVSKAGKTPAAVRQRALEGPSD